MSIDLKERGKYPPRSCTTSNDLLLFPHHLFAAEMLLQQQKNFLRLWACAAEMMQQPLSRLHRCFPKSFITSAAPPPPSHFDPHCLALPAQVKKQGWAAEMSSVAKSSRQSWGIQGRGVAGRSSLGLQAEHEAGMANSTGKGRRDALVVWAHGQGKGLDLMAREAPSRAFHLCCFLSFLWRTGSSSPTSPNTATKALEEENSLWVN